MKAIPLHLECKECNTVLEAPLMAGSKPCCLRAVKDMCLQYLKETFKDKLGRPPTPEEMLPYYLAMDMFMKEDDDG